MTHTKNRIVCDSPRTGVTLTEVLMSLMIMSIGVSAVAVLFPISTLRSIQANQLTHGAIVKYNVEALLQTAPGLIFDPDNDGNLREHFQAPVDRNYIVDPLGFYTHYADGSPFYSYFGNDGATPAGILQRFGGGLRTMVGFDHTNSAADAQALRFAALALSNQGDGWLTDVDTVPLSLISTADGVIGVQLLASPDLDLSQQATSELIMPALLEAAGGSMTLRLPFLVLALLAATPALAQPADLPIPAATTSEYPPGVTVRQIANSVAPRSR